MYIFIMAILRIVIFCTEHFEIGKEIILNMNAVEKPPFTSLILYNVCKSINKSNVSNHSCNYSTVALRSVSGITTATTPSVKSEQIYTPTSIPACSSLFVNVMPTNKR